MPSAEQFKDELHKILYDAYKKGQAQVEITSGELHKSVGAYPGPDHRMPVCCRVMRECLAQDAGDRILAEPPEGQGATLRILYVLPRPIKA